MKSVKLLTLFLLVGFALPVFAQSKHPRVVELEKMLNQDALEVLKSRFPDKPFFVNASVVPMFRDQRKASNETVMPYLDGDVEIKDEWDDPSWPLSALLGRVKKIEVSVSIPSSFTDDEISELKTSLFASLHMTTARDEVVINKRNWGMNAKPVDTINWQYILFASVVLAILLLSLWGISIAFSKKLSKSLTELAPADKGQSGPSSPMPMAQAPVIKMVPSEGPRSGSPTQVHLSDPFKNRDILGTGVKLLEKADNFPSLEDMLALNTFAKNKPEEFGAVLQEFSPEIQKKLFGLSSEESWMESVVNPGEPTSEAVELINKCLKISRNSNPEIQNLLILVNRLGKKSKEFFAGMNQEDILGILYYLPKTVSLKIAKETCPGSWGSLLNPSFTPKKIASDKVKVYTEKAINLCPLKEFSEVGQYKNEREIMEFLKNADFQTEKDIYLTLDSKSFLNKVRVPFFKVVESSNLKEIVSQFSLSDVALAAHQLPREEFDKISACFDDKFAYKFKDLVKSLDSNPPEHAQVNEVREKMGKMFKDEKAPLKLVG